MKKYIALFVSLLSICLVANAQNEQEATTEVVEAAVLTPATPIATPEQKWEMANTAYNEGNYADATELYEAILADNLHSAKLYFNLGNAYYKQEKLGKAILNYHRALRLAPADEDIRHNLEYATQATKDNIEQIPEFFLTTWVRNVRNLMGSNGWTVTSLIMLVIALSAALAYLLAQRLSLRKIGFFMMCATTLLFILSTIFAYNKRQTLVSGTEAVIMSSAAPIKSSPDRAATDLFVLHEGTKLSIEESIDGWVEIRIADGRKGWIESSRIERI